MCHLSLFPDLIWFQRKGNRQTEDRQKYKAVLGSSKVSPLVFSNTADSFYIQPSHRQIIEHGVLV